MLYNFFQPFLFQVSWPKENMLHFSFQMFNPFFSEGENKIFYKPFLIVLYKLPLVFRQQISFVNQHYVYFFRRNFLNVFTKIITPKEQRVSGINDLNNNVTKIRNPFICMFHGCYANYKTSSLLLSIVAAKILNFFQRG